MDQYCIIYQRPCLQLADSLVNFVEELTDLWDNEDSDDLEGEYASIGALSPELAGYFGSIPQRKRDEIVRLFCSLECYPVRKDQLHVSFLGFEEEDAATLSDKEIRAFINSAFDVLGADKVKFVSERKWLNQVEQRVAPMVGGIVEGLVAVVKNAVTPADQKPEVMAKNMMKYLDAEVKQQQLIATLSEGLTPAISAMAEIRQADGPELSSTEQARLVHACGADEVHDIEEQLHQLIALVPVLVALANAHGRPDVMDISNQEIFEDILTEKPELMFNEPLNQHFATFYSERLLELSTQTHLGTLIALFDNALYFSDMAFALKDNTDATSMMSEGISSYEDFMAWQHYLVMHAYSEVYDEKQAA